MRTVYLDQNSTVHADAEALVAPWGPGVVVPTLVGLSRTSTGEVVQVVAVGVSSPVYLPSLAALALPSI